MSEKYVHTKIETKAEGGSSKAVLIILDGVKKWIPYSKILTLDISEFTNEGVNQIGTVEVNKFKEMLKAGKKLFIESIEIDEWMAVEVHGLEIIDE